LELQKKIVDRERQLNMTPVLPAFAGHVPAALKTVHPSANINKLGHWGGFDGKYRSSFLDPLDPLFKKIQKEFLTEQTKLFGTDHIYGTDPFNEVEPPSWEPEYLAQVGQAIHESMTEVDPDASWLQMTWVFYFDRKHWTNERIKAMVRSVPQDKMILLDYYCESQEVWKMTEKFFGQPYIWCYLGNFGGNTMLAGNLKTVESRIENTFKNGGDTVWGLGSTLEALDVNPVMYEFLFEKAWTDKATDLETWIANYADTRCGAQDEKFREGWDILLKKVYTRASGLGQGVLMNARPSLGGNGSWTTSPYIQYDNRDLLRVWKLFLETGKKDRDAYQYDLVNVSRQVGESHREADARTSRRHGNAAGDP
jgi:alpha-N-acetylglucosaminidase